MIGSFFSDQLYGFNEEVKNRLVGRSCSIPRGLSPGSILVDHRVRAFRDRPNSGLGFSTAKRDKI